MEGREFVHSGGHTSHEILSDEIGVLPQRVIHVKEDDPLALPLLLQAMVDHLALILGPHTSEGAPLSFGDPQAFVHTTDVLRDLPPLICLLNTRVDVVEDVLKIEVGEIRAKGRRGEFLEYAEAPKPVLEHPRRLPLLRADPLNEVSLDAPVLLPKERRRTSQTNRFLWKGRRNTPHE
jgi:hypothetical protein